jgi:hypothetical protein
MNHLILFEKWVDHQTALVCDRVKNINIKKGDYVLLDTSEMFLMNATIKEKQKFGEFKQNNIGVVNNVNIVHNNITIKYENIPAFIKHLFNYDGTILINPKYVKYYDSDLENLKIKIKSENYNL